MKKFLLLLPAILILSSFSREPGQYDTLALCMTEKGAIMYGSDECTHCLSQKEDFEGSFDLITYVECRKQKAECEKEAIVNTPTWKIDGKRYMGRRSLSELAELSGCKL